jgi:enoyl-CoA hydratase
MKSSAQVLVQRHQGLCTITLDNPGKLNALTVQMWLDLRKAFEQVQQSDDRCVLLQGANGQFAAGGDIEEFLEFRFQADRLRHFHEQQVKPALDAIWACDVPVIAKLDQFCVGGGLEMAACCDLRIAGLSCRLGIPIGKLGFPLAVDEMQHVLRVVPHALLREMLLEARLYDAPEALQKGLVHRVVKDEDLEAEVQQSVARIMALSPLAQRLNKRTLRQLLEARENAQPFHEVMNEPGRQAHFAFATAHDHREGIMAFIDKRKPQFKGY